jgi:hypothetical protein
MKRFAALVVALASVVLLASCSFNPLSLLPQNTTQLSRDRAANIVDALNAHDAAALKAMFTEYALTEYPAEIDDGLEYLLSLFPEGDVILQEPTFEPGVSGADDYGKKTTLVSSSYVVSSGGANYSLFVADFTVNTIDPKNVGVYLMGAVLATDSEVTEPEAAFRSWANSVDVHTSHPPGVFVAASGRPSVDRMSQIVDALNAHNALELKGMFTDYARAEYSTQIDDGLDYLLSLFPDGDVMWKEDQGGSAVYKRIDGDKKTVLLQTFYFVSSGGVDYRFFFADFTENSIDPDNVGVYAIGAVPMAEARVDVPEAYIYPWASSFDVSASSPPGIYIPQ